MHIVLHTRYASYTGEILIPTRGTGEGGESYRLQDVLNNPLLLYKPDELRSRMIPLREVKVIFEGSAKIAMAEFPMTYLDPAHVEVVYALSQKTYDTGKANLERHLTSPHAVQIEIVTYSQRRISGVASLGLRMLTIPEPDKKFFALGQARIKSLVTEEAEEEVPFILINRDYVVSFRELPAGE